MSLVHGCHQRGRDTGSLLIKYVTYMERGGREGGHWVVVGLSWGEWVGGWVGEGGGTIV